MNVSNTVEKKVGFGRFQKKPSVQHVANDLVYMPKDFVRWARISE